MFPHLDLAGLVLTFLRMASFDISGDANDGQRVDAYEAEEQCEEAIYLERHSQKQLLIHYTAS